MSRKVRVRAARTRRVIAAYTRALETNLVTPEEFLTTYPKHLPQSELARVRPILDDAYASGAIVYAASSAIADADSGAIADVEAEKTRRPGFVSRFLRGLVPYGRSQA